MGSPVARNKTSTGETKGKLLTSEPVSEHANQSAQQSIGPTISGKTQVRGGSKDGHPVVVLKGYKLRETSSKKVHEFRKKSDSNAFAYPVLVNAVDQQSASCNDRLQVRTNKTHHVLCDAARMTTNRIPTEKAVPDSELQKIAASSRKHSHDNRQQTHEGENEFNNSANAALGNETKSTLQSNMAAHDKGMGNSSLILPVSFDNLTSQQANSIATGKIVPDPELQNITELFDEAASSRKHLHDNRQQTHKGKNGLNNSVNAGLGNERKSALKRNEAHDKGMGNSSLIFPVSFDNLTNQHANRVKTEEIVPDSNLQEIAELFDDEASTRRPFHDNRQQMHEGKKRLNNSANADLGNGTKDALQSIVSLNKVKGNSNLIVPISSDDVAASQQTFQRVTTLGIDMHEQPDTSAVHLTSTINDTVKHNDSYGMHKHLFTAAAGNKHQNSNDSLLQVSVCITG